MIGVIGLAGTLVWASTIEGVVRERGTGDPIPDVTVRVAGRTTVTDEHGAFVLEDLPDHDTLGIRASGEWHEEQEQSFANPFPVPLIIYMTPLPPPLEIVIEAHRDSLHISRQILDRERVEETPGTHDDPIRLLQSLPGVSSTPEYSPTAGAISIRGAQPGESRVLFDGVELPYLYHFQQYASVIHTRMLDELRMYPSGFGAGFGESVGGIVDVLSREPDAERFHGGANLNAIMAGGYVRAPVGEWQMSASGRRSFMDVFEGSNDQYTLWPSFWDYMGRLDGRTRGLGRLSATIIGAGDAYGRYAGDTESLDPVEQQTNPSLDYERGFHGLILRHSWEHDRAELVSVAGLVRDDWTVDLDTASQMRLEHALTLRHQQGWLLSDQFRLDLGLENRVEWLQRRVRTDRAWPEITNEAPLLASGSPVEDTMSTWLAGVWIEPLVSLGNLRIQPGLRASGDGGTGEWVPEPRFIARLRLGDFGRIGTAITRSSMAPPLDFLSAETGNPDLGRSVSDQVSLSTDWVIGGRWEIGIEGWMRSIRDAIDIEGWGTEDWIPRAVDGRARGLEITSRYRLRERFFSSASLTLGHSERGGYLMGYDQPVAFDLMASWDFRPNWNIGLRYRYGTGLPYTPIVAGLYDGDTDRYVPIIGETNSARMGDYRKVDLHLERRVVFDRWALALYLEAWWVPPSSNGLYRVYSYDYSESELVAGPAFVPLVGARAEY